MPLAQVHAPSRNQTRADAHPDPEVGRLMVALDGRIVAADNHCARLFGCHKDALCGRPIAEFLPRLASKPGADCWLSSNTVFLSHCEMPFRAVRADGTRFVAQLSFFRVTEEGEERVVVLIRPLAGVSVRASQTSASNGLGWCLE